MSAEYLYDRYARASAYENFITVYGSAFAGETLDNQLRSRRLQIRHVNPESLAF